jgi:hypothetical protein
LSLAGDDFLGSSISTVSGVVLLVLTGIIKIRSRRPGPAMGQGDADERER